MTDITDSIFVAAVACMLLTKAVLWWTEAVINHKHGQDWLLSVKYVNMVMDRLHAAEAKCAALEHVAEEAKRLRLTGESNYMDFSDGLSLVWNIRTGLVKLRDDRVQKGRRIFDMDDEHWRAILFNHPVTFALAHQPEYKSDMSSRRRAQYFFPCVHCKVQLLGGKDGCVTVREMVQEFVDNQDLATAMNIHESKLHTYFGLHRQQANRGIQYCLLMIDETLL